eukprot:1192048-Prorocentrum_minimum.AAC.1
MRRRRTLVSLKKDEREPQRKVTSGSSRRFQSVQATTQLFRSPKMSCARASARYQLYGNREIPGQSVASLASRNLSGALSCA